MTVHFYFDPSCPFCWITSRWLAKVEAERKLELFWRPFSLAIKNDELDAGGDDKTPHGDMHRSAHRVLRVMSAANKQHQKELGELYTVFGKKNHVDGREYDDGLIGETLAELGLPADLVDAAQDDSLDAWLTDEIVSATDVVGDDVGVPTILFEIDGTKRGFFGPVLQSLPDDETCLKLWDGLSALAEADEFYELKRTRPDGSPDTGSTARMSG